MSNHPDFRDLAWDVSEEVYRADPALSYSKISRFLREGIGKIDNLDDKVTSASLTFGSLVDCLFTAPEEFPERYVVANEDNVPSGKLKDVIDLLLSSTTYSKVVEVPEEEIHKACIECKYYIDDRYKSSRLKNVHGCAEYFNAVRKTQGKNIITQDQLDKAMACVNALRANTGVSKVLEVPPFDGEIFYQLKFTAKMGRVALRCMADIITVDHAKKLVRIIDLKTTSKVEDDFPESVIEWNYGIQAQMYYDIIRARMNQHEDFKDYELDDFHFIVVRNNGTPRPLAFKFDQTKSGKVGYTIGDHSVPSWRKIAAELEYYLSSGVRHYKEINAEEVNSIENVYAKRL